MRAGDRVGSPSRSTSGGAGEEVLLRVPCSVEPLGSEVGVLIRPGGEFAVYVNGEAQLSSMSFFLGMREGFRV